MNLDQRDGDHQFRPLFITRHSGKRVTQSKSEFRKGIRALGASLLVIAVLWAGLGPAPAAGHDEGARWGRNVESTTRKTPEIEDIPRGGLAWNFRLVGHNPLLDSNQGSSSFDPYINPPMGVPRGSNGDITAAGDCVYVGSLIGYQPALIVDVSNPARPTVVGAVPDLVPGVGNGIEGIEASDDLLVIDQRRALGGLRFPVPAGLPTSGIAIYDIGKGGSNCRSPRLVARFEYKSAIGGAGKDTHTISLWRDPTEPRRVLGVQSFTDEEPVDNTAIQVVDLTGCPQLCNPKVVAKWSARTQYGLDRFGNPRAHTHEAIVSSDGNRFYVSQWQDGFLMLDSSKLIRTLRGQDTCDPNQVTTPSEGADNCIKPLNASYEFRAASLPIGWSHTPMRVPDRPYLFETSESPGPSVARDSSGRVLQPARIASTCPGSLMRMIYIGEDGYFATAGFDAQGRHIPAMVLRGDLYPTPLSHFGTEEQKFENCGPDGFQPGTAPLTSWFSPHQGLVFSNLAFVTYYGAGLRAIDISNPYILREVGSFINKPVGTVRWASYGITGDWGFGPGGQVRNVSTLGQPPVFAFSYVLSHNGYIIYSDVHSGLYILKYTGPHNDEIPQVGNCLTGNPGAVAPGYDPCPPYGKWDSPANAWTKERMP